jgi:beta-glucosidase
VRRRPGGGSPKSRALARRAAEESFVLLENRKVGGAPLLPLAAAAAGRKDRPDRAPGRQRRGHARLVVVPGRAKRRRVTLRSRLAERAAREGMLLTMPPGTDISGTSDAGFAEAIRAAGTRMSSCSRLGRAATARARPRPAPASTFPATRKAPRGRRRHGQARRPGRLQRAPAGDHVGLGARSRDPDGVVSGRRGGAGARPHALRRRRSGGRLTVSVPRSVGQVPIYYNALNTGRPRVDPIGLGSTKPDPYYVTGYIDEKTRRSIRSATG